MTGTAVPSAPGSVALVPGEAALAVGRVVHHRLRPVEHRFDYPMTQVWIDPDDPGRLFDRHPLWSHRRPAPVRFRCRDHLDGSDAPLGPRVRDLLAERLGRPVDGPLRMLTQPRVWGWLFNPITVFLAWDDPGAGPVAALLEVTNTPWKERHHYGLALEPVPGDEPGPAPTVRSTFAKALHVSPFLDLDHTYSLTLGTGGSATMLDLSLDVIPVRPPADAGPTGPILRTRLITRRLAATQPGTRRAMTAVLRPDRLPTHRVSAGIHRQAATLWRRRVPFVPHPDRRR